MASKLKTDILETVSGSGTIALTNQLSGMTAASMPTGSVVQVVNATAVATQTSTSTSFVQYSALTASITPTSTSNKILVMFSGDIVHRVTGAANSHFRGQIYRGSSAVSSVVNERIYDYGGSGIHHEMQLVMHHLDTPATTSTTTYSLYFANTAGANSDVRNGTITLTEIKG